MKVINVSKYIAYAFLSLLTLVIILVLLALSPLGVSALVHFANQQEGVAISNASGSFYSQVTLGKVTFNNSQIAFDADALKLDVGINCVFNGTACVDNLSARKIEMVLLESDQPSEPSSPLSDYIELPIAAYLKKFAIDQVSIYTKKIDAEKILTAQLVKLNASLSMHKTLLVNQLSVEEATVYSSTEAVQLPKSESKGTSAEQLIELVKNANYEPFELPQFFVPINAELQDVSMSKFCVKQESALCTVQTRLNASIINQTISATFVTRPEGQLAASIELKAKLDFAKAYEHDISLKIQANPKLSSSAAQALTLTLQGNNSGTFVALNSPRASTSILTLNAQVDVTQANLPVNINLVAENYQGVLKAWLPETYMPVSTVNMVINGDTQAYNFSASASLDTERASDITAQGMLSVTEKILNLNELKTSGDLGKLNASIESKLSQFSGVDGISLQSKLSFKNVQVSPLVPQIDSQLNGDINLLANVTPKQLWGNLNCKKLEGMVQGYKLSLLCDMSINKAGLVLVKALSLKQGKNTVAAKGQFTLPSGLNTSQIGVTSNDNTKWIQDTQTSLAISLNMLDLKSLYAKASGTIVGSANITGKINTPSLQATINLDGLNFNDLNVKQAKVDVLLDVAKDWQTNVNVAAQVISQQTLLAQQADFSINGNLSAHTIKLDLQHPEYSFNHEISGQGLVNSENWRWSGLWEKGLFTFAFDSFSLDQPTPIRVNSQRASIRGHCWLSKQLSGIADNASASTPKSSDTTKALCIDKLQYSEDLSEVSAKLAYNIKVPLLHYFPEIIKQGTSLPLSTDIELAYSPQKGVVLDTYSLMTQAKLTTSKHDIELVAVVANSSLQDQVLKSNIFAGTKSTGALGVSSTLKLDPNDRTHKGQIRIENFLLSPLQRFIPSVEKLSGAVVGNILFDGLLTQPQLNGELNINDVELFMDNYPYPITNFNQTMVIANKQAQIEGEFELGSGVADYSGTLRLFDNDKPFSFVGKMQGAGMQLAFGDNEVLASPSLNIAVDPDNFSLKGEVTIPNAQIKIAKLPENARSPSSDTIIIGQPPEPPLVPIGLDIDVRVLLDPPKLKRVTINALDLEASLGGDVRVVVKQMRNPATQEFTPLETYVYGSVDILSGSYEAYGQNLQVQKGAIFFSGAPSLPQFDITAVRNPLNTADNVIAGIRISGNPAVPKVELFSQPSMTQARQLSYLLQGTDLDGGSGQSQDIMLVNMLVNFGVGNSENGVNRFGKSLGFDSLNLQTAGQGANTQVQLTGRISDNIQVSYGVGLFDQASEVILRYQLLPQMYFEAKSGATSAVDIFYEWTRGQ
jgi:translocation and assembly module TamB